MGFLSYEHPQIVKHQFDLKGKEVQTTSFNVQIAEDSHVRDCVLLPNNNIAAITSSKQLIVQGQEQNGLQNEMMNLYN